MRQIHQSLLAAVLDLRPHPHALLDIGSGGGALTHALAVSLPQTRITALDQKASEVLGSGITFVPGKAEALPFIENSFDAITASLSLHHWQNKQKGIEEAFRVLKNGGHLMIGDPLLEGPLRNRFLGWLAQVTDGGTFATPEEIKGYLSYAGFINVTISVTPSSFKTLYVISAQKP